MDVQSADGTTIACQHRGSGPAVLLVDGALCYRASGPATKLAEALAGDFTVWTYDRRGRGDSGDTPPYGVQREVEDMAAVIGAAGGSAYVAGVSSGAALAMHAAAAGLPVGGLALYEPPFAMDAAVRADRHAYKTALDAALAGGRRGDAVRLFMRLVGLPAPMIALLRLTPAWRRLCAVAGTLPYDYAALLDDEADSPVTAERWAGVTVPALVLAGAKSPETLLGASRGVAEVLPDARYRELPGQTHMVKAAVVAPLLAEFFSAGSRAVGA